MTQKATPVTAHHLLDGSHCVSRYDQKTHRMLSTQLIDHFTAICIVCYTNIMKRAAEEQQAWQRESPCGSWTVVCHGQSCFRWLLLCL